MQGRPSSVPLRRPPTQARPPKTTRTAPRARPSTVPVRHPGGSALTEGLRVEMEGALGADLRGVQIYDDPAAGAAAGALGTRAFTRNGAIVFGPGQYRPHTPAGRELLMHELVHAVQQTGPPVADGESSVATLEAEAAAVAGGRRGPVTRRGRADLVMRDPKPVTPAAKPITTSLDTSTILDVCLELLAPLVADPQLKGLSNVQNEVRRLLASPADVAAVNAHDRAQRLLEALTVTSQTFTALKTLGEPGHYLGSVSGAIVKQVGVIRDAYMVGVFRSFGDAPDPHAMDRAEALMLDLPGFITQQYLGPTGIPGVVRDINRLREQLIALSSQTGTARISHPIDDVLDEKVGMLSAKLINLWVEGARRSVSSKQPDAFDVVQGVAGRVQFVFAAWIARVNYEQFLRWHQELSDSYINKAYRDRDPLARKWMNKFDTALNEFVKVANATYPTGEALAVAVQGAMEGVQRLIADPDYKKDSETIGDRLKTIKVIDAVAQLVLITAAAALTGGAAGAAASPALLAATGSAEIASVGAFVAEGLAFTVTSRAGQSLVFGQAQGDFSSDLAWNLLTLGAIKGIGSVYGGAIKAASGVEKIVLNLGRVATTGLVLHGLGELHAAATGHTMTDEERYRSVVQNAIMLAAFELGSFVTKPIEERISAAIGAKFKPIFEGRLKSLAGDRAAVQSGLEALRRGTATAAEVNAALKRIETIWNREVAMLDEAVKRKIMTADEADAVLSGYTAEAQRLQLRLATLGIAESPAAGAPGSRPVFRPQGRGVVSFTPEGRGAIEATYKQQGGQITSIGGNILLARLPNGEITILYPEGAAPESLPEASRLATATDSAHAAAALDPDASAGLALLGDAQKWFGAVKLAEILAAVPDGGLGSFLRDISEILRPAAGKTTPRRDTAVFQFLATHARARELVLELGADVVQRVRGAVGDADAIPALERVGDALAAAPTEAARAELRAKIIGADTRAKLDVALGAPKPPRARPPARPRGYTGPQTSDPSWSAYEAQATKFASDHGETLTPDNLRRRAAMLQIIGNAKKLVYARWARQAKLDLLDQYDMLGRQSGAETTWINQARGDLAEWLFSPGRGMRRRFFLKHVDVGRSVTGVSILDYGLETGQTRADGQPQIEWVDLKSDYLGHDRTGAPKGKADPMALASAEGKAAARQYLKDATADQSNLPVGDTISLHFVRDPGPFTRKAMVDILLLTPGTPVSRVRIGDIWYDRAHLP